MDKRPLTPRDYWFLRAMLWDKAHSTDSEEVRQRCDILMDQLHAYVGEAEQVPSADPITEAYLRGCAAERGRIRHQLGLD
jgi:hypothetical protein